MTDENHAALKEVGLLKDGDINLAKTALLLGRFNAPAISLERYENHIIRLCDEVTQRHAFLIAEGANDDAGTQLAALKHVMIDTHDYRGDLETYDDLQNVNLLRVIDRRKGMPVSIALLYIHVGQTQGWQVDALNFPAHVVCRIEKNGQRLLFDPFHSCKILQAADLRQLLKTLLRSDAELSTVYYEASTKREILIRLQNNIKLRLIENEEYGDAVKIIEQMRLIDPNEYRLLFDAGVLYARINKALAAITSLEQYVDLAPHADRHEALLILNQIKEDLN